jgi:hypothetical protein
VDIVIRVGDDEMPRVAGHAPDLGMRAATVTWDPNSEPDLAAYTLSYGTQSGVHTVVVDVGNVTTH